MADSNFIEYGYRPATEIKDELDALTLSNPSYEDQIHFFKSESCTIPELQQAINSVVLVSEYSDTPGGSGIIVSYEGNRYVVTAIHVVGDLLAGEYSKESELKYFYRDRNNDIKEGIMSRLNLLYDSTTARGRALPVTDAAIFRFDGDNLGTEMSDEDVDIDDKQVAVAIGFPDDFNEGWKESKKPLLSIGRVFRRKPKEYTPAIQAIIEEHTKKTGEKLGPDLNIFYTGRCLPGNSGGPLIDINGKVIAVCHGPRGTLGKEDGIERFSDFRPILKTITQ